MSATVESVDTTDMKSKTSEGSVKEFSDTSVEEYVGLSNKQKLLPGDSVLYRLDHHEPWAPKYGTVLNKPAIQIPLIPEMKNDDVEGEAVGTPTTAGVRSETDDYSSFAEVKLVEDDLAHVRWAFSNRIDPVDKSKLCLVDRFLERGQFVRNNENQLGIITGKEVKAVVQILGTDHVVTDVPVSSLKPMTPFVRGQRIRYKDWIGIISTVQRNLYFRLDGGMQFYLQSIENDGFEKTDIYNLSEKICPGSRLRLPFSVFRRAKWEPTTMKFLSKWFPPLPFLYSFSSVTTVRADVIGFTVEWLWCLNSDTEQTSIVEPEKKFFEEQFAEIEPIGIPSSELVQVDSVRIYKLKPEDLLTKFSVWLNGFRTEFMDQNVEQTGSGIIQIDPSPNIDVPIKVIMLQTYVDVEWEPDHTKETILGTKIPYVYPIEADFPHYPGLVLTHSLHQQEQKYGIVQYATEENREKKTIFVKWIIPEAETEGGTVIDLGVQEESIYDVKPHSRYMLYIRGTIVLFNKPIDGQIGGSVTDFDIRSGQMIIGTPMNNETVSVYPHSVTPIKKACSWNFFSRQWHMQDLIPPLHQLGVETESVVLENSGIVLNLKNYNVVKKVRNWAPDIPTFEVLENAPENHKYFANPLESFNELFYRNASREFTFLQDNIPTGIWIRVYEDRMDLISIMLLGEIETPYEDGLFMFDVQLTADFPNSLPKVKFVVYSNPLSPFADNDGAFCTSKLIWEFDSCPASYILNLCHQLQRLLFHAEPFYEDDRNQNLKGSLAGEELSREYNERVYIEVLTSFHNMAFKPHNPWQLHIGSHLDNILPYKIREVKQWLRLSAHDGIEDEENDAVSEEGIEDIDKIAPPPYPLLPFSYGFKMAFMSRYEKMKQFFQVHPDEELVKEKSSSTASAVTEVKETSESVDITDENESIIRSIPVNDETTTVEEEPVELQEIIVVSES